MRNAAEIVAPPMIGFDFTPGKMFMKISQWPDYLMIHPSLKKTQRVVSSAIFPSSTPLK